MSKHDDGGAAFPVSDAQSAHRIALAETIHIQDDARRERAYIKASAAATQGMTLRDYFAAKELASIHDKALCTAPEVYERCADHCYRMADAMLAARGGNDGR